MTATTYPAAEPAWLDISAPLSALLRQVAAAAVRRPLHWIENGGGTTPNGLDLADAIAAIGEAAIAEATRKSYAGALHRFGRWLDGRKMSDDLLAEYLGALYEAGKSYNSANQIAAALKRSAREVRDNGRCVACPVGPATRRRLDRYRRDAAGRTPKQAEGIGWEDADRMCEAAESDGGPRGVRDAALVGAASDGLLRVSEASALDADDVTFMDDGSARLRIRRSKTDQAGRGAELYLGAPTAGRIRQ